MKNLCIGLSLVFALLGVQGKEAVPLAENPELEQRMIAISEEMRCLVCQNESLAGSRSELANDLRKELRDLIKEGKTDAEIKDFMVNRYGDFVLYRPPVKPSTWLLWLGPFVLLVIGILFLLAQLKQMREKEETQELSEEEKDRLEKLLGDVERKNK